MSTSSLPDRPVFGRHVLDRPVFARDDARRRRAVARAGTAAGVLLTLATAVMAYGFTSSGPYHPPSWPDPTVTAPLHPSPAHVAGADRTGGGRR